MKKIILSEEQSRALAKMLEEEMQQMPVSKKVNKPYCIDPEKVQVVKKYLDKGFTAHDFERIGSNGYPEIIKIVTMNASNGEPLRQMYANDVKEMLIDKFQNMFIDKVERELFMGQVLKDWLNHKIGVHGTLSVNSLNESTVTSDMVDERANETDTDPTDAQKEAGNYKMGHISIKGMPISIENPKGSIRKFKKPNGEEGQTEMKNHYGYFTNTTGNGKDGDAVDVFVGPHPDDFEKIFVIDQKIGGSFDESKVMLGFYSKKEAVDAYLSNYDPSWKGFWKVTAVSIKTFKRWLYRDHKQRKPFFDYVAIKKHKLEEGNNSIKITTAFDEKAAMEIAEELNASAIRAFNIGKDVLISLDSMNSDAEKDRVIAIARRKVQDYNNTHND